MSRRKRQRKSRHRQQPRGNGGSTAPKETAGAAAVTLDVADVKDRRLMVRAIRDRWPLSDEQRQEIMNHLAAIATGKVDTRDGQKPPSHRDAISAAREVFKADAQNQSDEHRAAPAPPKHVKHDHTHRHHVEQQRARLDAIAGRLGTRGDARSN